MRALGKVGLGFAVVSLSFLAGFSSARAADATIYNFETDTQGWQSTGEPIITLAQSTAQAYAGEGSLGIQFNDEGFAAVRVLDSSVDPGDIVTFRIYLPANNEIEWIQINAQGGGDGGWEWHGQWIESAALQAGAWNTLTLQIPSDAAPVYALGVELFAGDLNAGTVYLDSIDYGPNTDTSDYHFELDTQGWDSFRDPIATLSVSDAHSFTGNRSLAVDIDGEGLAVVGIENPAAEAGDVVTFNVYLPADAGIDWIQPFAIEGEAGNWAWHGNWQPVGALTLGAWNTIEVTVPETATALAAIGVEISVPDAYTGTIYVDSVDAE